MSTPEFSEERGQSSEEPSFVASLFDYEFQSFITLRFIKVIYVVALVIIALTGLVFLVAAIAGGDFVSALFALFFMAAWLIAVRVSLEVIALLFRIGKDTAAIRKTLDER